MSHFVNAITLVSVEQAKDITDFSFSPQWLYMVYQGLQVCSLHCYCTVYFLHFVISGWGVFIHVALLFQVYVISILAPSFDMVVQPLVRIL